ncbi:MAG: hypothetical protein R3257_06050, partial [bacterium]|nr:hypothetical protein [bacterium]
GEEANLLGRLSYIRDLGAQGRPRVLIHQMDPQDPFMGWFSLLLPAVLARYGGSYAQARVRLKGFDPHLPEELRRWTPLALWALSQSINGSREPVQWFEHLPPEGERDFRVQDILGEVMERVPDFEVVERDLANAFHQGNGAAAVPHALLAFLRSPYAIKEALETAALAPVAVREDAMALTGALLGGFHGKRIFSFRHLEEISGKSDQDIRNWFFNTQTLDPYVSRIRRDYEPQPENVLALPSLSEIPQRGIDSFAERLESIEDTFRGDLLHWRHEVHSLLRRAHATGVSQEEVRNCFESLDENIDALRSFKVELQSYLEAGEVVRPINKVSRSNDPKISGEKIKGILEQGIRALENLEGALARNLSSGPWFYLKPAGLKAVEQILREVDETFGYPHGEPISTSETKPIASESIRRIYEAAAQLGPARPKRGQRVSAWDRRSDWGNVQQMVRQFGSSSELSFSWDEFFQHYQGLVGQEPTRGRRPYKPESEFSLSSLLNVLTPAFLELRRQDPHRLYRELMEVPRPANPQNIEAWRGVTYLTARLLQGAEPNDGLLFDAHAALSQKGHSPIARRFHDLAEARRVGGKQYFNLLQLWSRSRLPVERVALGIHAFLESPQDLQDALVYANSFRGNRDAPSYNHILRVTGMLSAAHREGLSIP